MEIYTYLFNYLQDILGLYYWQDFIEITFIVSCIYYIQKWLAQDKHKNLLLGVYIYYFVTFIAWITNLSTISFIIFYTTPITLFIFAMLHQQALQKNFITLRKISPNASSNQSWFKELIQVSLNALNSHQDMIFVLERKDSLEEAISAPSKFNADFKKDIVEMLLQKHITSTSGFIWLTEQGKIVAINSMWKHKIDPEWIKLQAQKEPTWKQQGLFVTGKTDTILFKINPLSRTFDLIAQGKIHENIRAEKLFELLEHLLYQKPYKYNQSKIPTTNKVKEKELQ